MKIKKIIIENEDGTKEFVKEALIIKMNSYDDKEELRVRSKGISNEIRFQEYLVALMHFISEKINPELLDLMEMEADILEAETKNKNKN